MAREYVNPKGGQPSKIGTQIRTDYYEKKALIEAAKEEYFGQLADVTSMPKNMGKAIKKFLYLPLLADGNTSDQGIDAAGVTILNTQQFVSFPDTVTAANAGAAAAVTAINANINNAGSPETIATAGAAESGGTGRTLISLTKRSAIKYASTTQTNTLLALNIGITVQAGAGNLYGSSKDIGLISGKLPVLSENGGRVNRVGFKRVELEGNLEKFGFFDEYTQESIDFDSDEDLLMHVHREMVNGASQMTEAALQTDLLTSAGVIKYPGAATSNATITASTVVTYADLLRLSIDLDNNRTPKNTTVITGSRMVDTRTIPASRVMYIGSELLPTLRAMKDLHNNEAFIAVQKYADAGTALRGEVGSIDQFRIVVVPEMQKWAGAGGDASGSATHYETNQRFDVFPMLVVGDGSFATIGFQTDGKTTKFKITHKKPAETADRTDPFGETGFMSIKWYYGFMIQRAERLAVLKTAAAM